MNIIDTKQQRDQIFSAIPTKLNSRIPGELFSIKGKYTSRSQTTSISRLKKDGTEGGGRVGRAGGGGDLNIISKLSFTGKSNHTPQSVT